jgi:hypothetical protein
MKIKALLLSLTLVTAVIAGCTPKGGGTQTPQQNTQQQQQQQSNKNTASPDAVTTASIVRDEANFLKAVSKDGTWIIATLNDLTVSKDIVLEGQFKSKDVPARKIALYTQDDSKKVTNRFTLTAPKLIVRSENARIQSGTFIGDIYVEANGFQLVDAKVNGNIYFANDQYKSTYKADSTSSVTGVTEVKK